MFFAQIWTLFTLYYGNFVVNQYDNKLDFIDVRYVCWLFIWLNISRMSKIIILTLLVLTATAFKMGNGIEDPQQCIEEKCPKQWAACQKDSKCVPALQDCQNKCGTKQSCWEVCLAGKKDQAATDVAKCAAANDCLKETRVAVILNTPQECIEKYCKTEEQDCEHDRRCIRTLEFCNHQCHNDSDCWK